MKAKRSSVVSVVVLMSTQLGWTGQVKVGDKVYTDLGSKNGQRTLTEVSSITKNHKYLVTWTENGKKREREVTSLDFVQRKFSRPSKATQATGKLPSVSQAPTNKLILDKKVQASTSKQSHTSLHSILKTPQANSSQAKKKKSLHWSDQSDSSGSTSLQSSKSNSTTTETAKYNQLPVIVIESQNQTSSASESPITAPKIVGKTAKENHWWKRLFTSKKESKKRPMTLRQLSPAEKKLEDLRRTNLKFFEDKLSAGNADTHDGDSESSSSSSASAF